MKQVPSPISVMSAIFCIWAAFMCFQNTLTQPLRFFIGSVLIMEATVVLVKELLKRNK